MRLFAWLLDLIYPPKCVFCEALLDKRQTDLCPNCRSNLPYVQRDIERGALFRRCVSVLYYEKEVRDSVLRFKFRGKESYAQAYGRLLAMRLVQCEVEFDLISWVPVSAARLRKRGYDQSRLLAEATARELGMHCTRSLRKTRNNPAQSSRKSDAERAANVRNVYRPFEPVAFAGKKVLLIDDVITSGATLTEASRVLLTAGAARVECATLAAVRDKPKEGRN